jgi:hypothetical protein
MTTNTTITGTSKTRCSSARGLPSGNIEPAISEENHIDLAAFGSLCGAHVVLDLQRAVGRNVGMAPGGRVVTMSIW